LWTAVGLAALGLGGTLLHYSKPHNPERVSMQRRVLRVEQELVGKNMYVGTINEISNRWKKISQRAFEETSHQKNKIFPMSNEAVNQICESGFRKTGVDSNLLKAFFQAEASYDPSRVSHVGAMGGFQLMPEALTELHRMGITIANPFDPYQSAWGGGEWIKYISKKCQERQIKVGNRKDAHFETVQRTFWYQNREWKYHELPGDVQLKILAHVYNAGHNNVFGKTGTSRGYDVSLIIDNDYSRKVIETYYRLTGNG
jgi:hypothetical protein